jgi:glycosyltransferase involved in cell wall biosynthesis
MDDLITVVIPAYNRSKVIEGAIYSVLNQSYSNFEIIVVNDGSNDNTSDIVKQLVQQESKIKYLEHSISLGAQSARNTGIKAAKGEWIAFLDSDDQWLFDSLEKRLNLVKEQNIQVVYSECYVFTKDYQLKLFGIPPMKGNIYVDILTKPAPMFQSLLVSKIILEKINYLDENIIAYQEWDTAIRLAKDYQFGFVPEPTFIYDCRGSDTISKNILRGANGYKQIVKKHWKDILEFAGIGVLFQHYLNLSQQYRGVDDKQALVYALIGYCYIPNLVKIFFLKLKGKIIKIFISFHQKLLDIK